MKQINAEIADWWTQYGALALIGAGLAGLLSLIGLAIWARKTEKPLRPIALALSMNVALLLNAEGMWVIARQKLNLPPAFAVLVFAVFEVCFLTATSLAAERYRATTVYEDDGNGAQVVKKPGHPGPMLWVAALIAVLSGAIVASNAATSTETWLRLAVPCVIFLMWWAALVAAGQSRDRGRFAHSPRRLAERWGWLIPDADVELKKEQENRQVRRMVNNYYRTVNKTWPAAFWKSRFQRDARTVTAAALARVDAQIGRTETAVARLTAPRGTVVDGTVARTVDGTVARTVDGTVDGDGRTMIEPDGTDRDAVSGTARSSGTDHPAPSGTEYRAVPDGHQDQVSGSARPMGVGHRAVPDQGAASHRAVPELGVPDAREQVGHRAPAARRPDGHMVPGPVDPAQMTDSEQREDARRIYRASVDAGRPISGAELARMYRKADPKWGTRRINEVRAAHGGAVTEVTGTFPVVPAPAGTGEQQEDERR